MWQTVREDTHLYSQGAVDRWVYSTCNICSIGCGCYVGVKDEQVVGIKGNPTHPVNCGRLGPKGENQWYANRSPDRLRTPLMRDEHGHLVPVDWETAMNLLVQKTKANLRQYGPDSFAFYTTGQIYTEEYYTLAKVGRAGIGTHYMDANTRLCTATTQFGLMLSFGADGTPACFADIDETDCLVLVGHNVAETGTVLFERIMESRRQRNGLPRLIVIDPRRTLTARAADLHLQLRPGTNVPLLNGILQQILAHGKVNEPFVRDHTVGFAPMQAEALKYPPEEVERITGVPADRVIQAAEWIMNAPRLVMTTLQGTYQANDATGATVAVNNIHLVLGQIGRPGCGPLHTAGQPSSSSNRCVGGVGSYPGQRNPENAAHIGEIARLWNVAPERLPVGMMKSVEDMIDAMEAGSLKLFWVIGTNPLVSLPNRRRAKRAMANAFVVVQDIFLTETCAVADLVLPAAMWAEKEGTMENAERRVNLLKKAVEPPPGAKTDLAILLEFARRMDFRDKDGRPLIRYSTAQEAFAEWRLVSAGRPADMTHATYEQMEQLGGLHWPITAEHPEGTPRLYADLHFHTADEETQTFGYDLDTGRALTRREWQQFGADGRAILWGVPYHEPPEKPNAQYPFYLLSGRLVYQWHTRTKTARSPILHAAAPHAYAEINPLDAEKLQLIPGEMVRLTSPRGWITLPIRITADIMPGVLFVPMHYGQWQRDESPNTLNVDFVDPVSKQPNIKMSVCQLEPLRATHQAAEGETLTAIAERYLLTEEQIALANRLTPPYRVEPGTDVLIPSAGDMVLSPPYLPFREMERWPAFREAAIPGTPAP